MLLVLHLAGLSANASTEYISTFALIQDRVFTASGCNAAACHGEAAQGGLDLRDAVAYANLIDVDSATVDGIARVLPGQKERSLLWVNLAAATLPAAWRAPRRPMPLPPMAPLSEDALEVIRLWIEAGAPRDGVVRGTEGMLDSLLPEPQPLEIAPLPVPHPDAGVQIRMPGRLLPAQSDTEVCYATYYDLRGRIPAEALSPDGSRFRFRRNRIRQSPLSHHLFMFVYNWKEDLAVPSIFGEFRCKEGDRAGETCDPLDDDACGARGQCASTPVPGVGCVGDGVFGQGIDPTAMSFVQETSSDVELPKGVFAELPVQGFLLWNSHGVNPTNVEAKLEAWINFWFASAGEQLHRMQPFFNTDVRYEMDTPAFGTEEVCHIHTFPRGTRLFEISSHGHKRMKRWRTYLGAWRCVGGEGNGKACSPLGYDYASSDPCQGFPCMAKGRPRVADCDSSDTVTVDEIVTAVSVALGSTSLELCDQADSNLDRLVTVDEVIRAVRAALEGINRDAERLPEESLFYVNLLYDDPLMLRFEPSLAFDSLDSDERRVTYCALYDNGYTDPAEVKRRSTSPLPPTPNDIGGPCETPTHCTEGSVGAECSGDDDATRDTSCDSATDAEDGFCDACPLLGGATGDDEMCILWGEYYVIDPFADATSAP